MQEIPELVTPWSYESQLLLILVVSAMVGSIALYLAYRIKRRLQRRAARRRYQRRAQNSSTPRTLGSL